MGSHIQELNEQPPRRLGDGPVEIATATPGVLSIGVTTNDARQYILVSEYNAWRVFGMLALMLGIKLPAKLMRQIQLGDVSPEPDVAKDDSDIS